MKSFFSGFFLWWILCSAAHGQHRSNTIWYSLYAGATYSNMLGEGTVDEAWLMDYPTRPRPNADAGRYFIWGKKGGVGVSYEFQQKTLISIDLGYEEKGSRIPLRQVSYFSAADPAITLHPLDNTEYCNERISCISIPIKAEKQFRHFYFQMGMYSAIRLRAAEYGTVRVNDERVDYRNSGNSALLDLGMLLGAGLSFPLSDFYSLRVGISGAWNVTGNNQRAIAGAPTGYFYGQSLQSEIRLLRRIDRRRCYGI
jgi:hypothetical protein